MSRSSIRWTFVLSLTKVSTIGVRIAVSAASVGTAECFSLTVSELELIRYQTFSRALFSLSASLSPALTVSSSSHWSTKLPAAWDIAAGGEPGM